MYDSIIVGSGPAGLSAALCLKIHSKSFLWFGSAALSEKGRKAPEILNYPGFPVITGDELFTRFEEQISANGLEVLPKMVTTVTDAGGFFMVLADNEIYESKTVILCTGQAAVKTLPGEDEYLGRGVSYCATCDGMFYRKKKVGVLLYSRQFEHEAEYLAGLASEVVCFPVYREPAFEAENIRISMDLPAEIIGDKKLTGVRLKSGEVLDVDGLFIMRNAIEPTKLVPGLASEGGHITVDRMQRTSIKGMFAAGDCTGRPYQYTKAAGEGNVAAHSCIDYLAENK